MEDEQLEQLLQDLMSCVSYMVVGSLDELHVQDGKLTEFPAT